MNETVEEPEAVTGSPEPGLVPRVLMTFTSPGRLGEGIRRMSEAPWFWTLVPIAVITGLASLLTPTELLLQAAERGTQGPPGGGPGADPETMVTFFRATGTAGGLLGTFVVAFVIAGVLFLVFDVFLGQDIRYRRHLSATAHAMWIAALGALITFPLMLVQEDINLKLSLGLLLSDPTASYFGRFLNGVTIFGLWTSAALGVVESGLSGNRVSATTGGVVIVVLYLLWALGSAPFGFLTG